MADNIETNPAMSQYADVRVTRKLQLLVSSTLSFNTIPFLACVQLL